MDEPACGSGSTPKEQLTDQEEGEETRGNGRKGHRSVMRRLCSRFLSFPSCRVRPRANVFVKLCDAAEVELGCGGDTHNPSIANASSTVPRLSPFAPVSFPRFSSLLHSSTFTDTLYICGIFRIDLNIICGERLRTK